MLLQKKYNYIANLVDHNIYFSFCQHYNRYLLIQMINMVINYFTFYVLGYVPYATIDSLITQMVHIFIVNII